MLLDRIDIDAHGPLHRVELGPFSEHLNVVCGPEGSGKTAIARFIRDSLVNRQYPLGMMSSSTGTVVWADRNGMVHCRREKDGTADGRTTIDFEPRGDYAADFGPLRHSWISEISDSSDSTRSLRAIELPESLVDGVITDTAVTNVARVVSACVANGLDSIETYHGLPLGNEKIVYDRDHFQPHASDLPHSGDLRRGLRSQLADVEAELARLDSQSLNHQSLMDRRRELTTRLAGREGTGKTSENSSWTGHYTDQRRLPELCDLARKLRQRQSELRGEISDLDRGVSPDGLRHSSYGVNSRRYESHRRQPFALDDSLRRQLDDLDAQVIGWRRTLLEVRGLREAMVTGSVPRGSHQEHTWTDAAIRRRRLDGFLHSVDRYEQAWDAPRPRRHNDDIQERIDSATRQIDWLLARYASGDSVSRNWYDALPASASYRATTTLGDTLRAIRNDLSHVHQHATAATVSNHYRSEFGQLDELRQCEHWLVSAIDQLTSHRESILRGVSSTTSPVYETGIDYARLRSERVEQFDRVTVDLDACLAEVANIRRSLRSSSEHEVHYRASDHWTDREAMRRELSRIDEQLASFSRLQWLRERRRALMAQLGTVRQPDTTLSPLSGAASRWLVRLSGGRLRRVHWPHNQFRGKDAFARRHSGVSIDGRDETDCPAADRALTVMAVRMAAGDLLAATGQQVPLVFETNRDLQLAKIVDTTDPYGSTSPPFHQRAVDGRTNHALLAALHDYTRGGRQAIVLTSDEALSGQAARVGARLFHVHAQHVVHPHRPVWRPHYQSEQYVGPHPHTYGNIDAADYVPVPDATRPRAVVDINRDFDMAWREAYGFYDTPDQPAAGPTARTDWRAPGADYRDGYYYSDSYTTVAPQPPSQFDERGNWVSGKIGAATQSSDVNANRPANTPLHSTVAKSPFFLTVDSPIDQAPSVDAVAAARLRGLSVTHINHLMQQDSNRLADALGLVSVNAATIRRWKSECRLVCRVPQLRGFDARVLVGCGVTDPAQLAAIHPVDLLQEVEAFLATERGQQILASGSSHELSRITSWIAAANSSPEERAAAKARNREDGLREARDEHSLAGFDNDRYEYQSADRNGRSGRTGSRRRRGSSRKVRGQRNGNAVRPSDAFGPTHSSSNQEDDGYDDGYDDGNGVGYGRGSGSRGSRGSRGGLRSGTGRAGGYTGSRRRRSSSSTRNRSGASSGVSQGGREGDGRTPRRRRRRSGTSRSNRDLLQYARDSSDRQQGEEQSARTERATRETQETRPTRERHEQNREQSHARELRFYLQRNSPIVDAPSIGARLAERLNSVGIETVNDLLTADPDTLAEELSHRRVDSDVVVQWQQQAELLCRVPMLRGHDAQILVMAEVTTPEELAASDPQELFAHVDPISRSKEGRRVLRGGKLPDLEEVSEWVEFAQHTRELVAA